MDNDIMTGYLAGKSEGGGNNGGWGCGMWPWMMGMNMGMGGFGGMGWGGGMWEWIPLLLIAGLFGWGGGFGGNRGDCATQADLAAGFNNSAVLNKLNDITIGQANAINYNNQGFNGLNSAILTGFHGVDNAVCTLGYQAQQGFSGLSRELADCCCDIRGAIKDNTVQNLMNTNALQSKIDSCCCDLEKMNMQFRFDAAQANNGTLLAIDKLGDRIIGYLNDQTTQNLRDENQALRQEALFARRDKCLVDQLRPAPVPAYLTCNPFAASYGFGQNFGNGFGGFGFNRDGCGCGCAA